MPSRRQVPTWIALAALLMPWNATGQERTERDVVELIVRDGPQARAIRAESEVTRREQLARLAYPNPSLTYSRESAGFTEFLQAEQVLTIFGARRALSRAGVAATAAAEAERDVRLWQLRSDAAAAVARLLAARARVESVYAHRGEINRLVEILRVREREGEGSRLDRLRGEHESREVNQAVTAADVELTETLGMLVSMLPRDHVLTQIAAAGTTPRGLPEAEELFARATASRAELRALQQSRERTALEAMAARRARLPAPAVFGGLKRADTGASREAGVLLGVSLSVPLFDTGSREAARWTAEQARVEAERAAIEHRIRAEITGALAVLSLRQTAATSDRPEAVDDLLTTAEVAYREGEVGILEWLDAVRTSARAKERSIDLRLYERLAWIALERAVGERLW